MAWVPSSESQMKPKRDERKRRDGEEEGRRGELELTFGGFVCVGKEPSLIGGSGNWRGGRDGLMGRGVGIGVLVW